MKPSIVATMLIALVFSGPAYSDLTITSKERGDTTLTLYGNHMMATIENGEIQFRKKGKMCWFWNHAAGEYTKAFCKEIAALFKRIRAEMMQGMSEQDKSMLTSVSEGPSQTRRLDDGVVAGYPVKCRETGQWGEKGVCDSKEVHALIVKTVGRDPGEWMKEFEMDMDKQKSDPWEKDSFVMLTTNYFADSGLNSFVLASMPKQECERLIKEAKQRKPPPDFQVLSVEKRSVKIDDPPFKRVDPEPFFTRMAGGAGTDGTKSQSTDPGGTGTLLQGLKIPKTKGGDQNKTKGGKMSLKERMEAAKKLLKDIGSQ